MNAYLDFDGQVFKGKVILLPCDDPTWSNFTLYFAQNFSRLGIKKLICTSYAHDSKGLGFEYTPHPEEADHTLMMQPKERLTSSKHSWRMKTVFQTVRYAQSETMLIKLRFGS